MNDFQLVRSSSQFTNGSRSFSLRNSMFTHRDPIDRSHSAASCLR